MIVIKKRIKGISREEIEIITMLIILKESQKINYIRTMVASKSLNF